MRNTITTSSKHNMIPFHTTTLCPLPLKGKRRSCPTSKFATNLNAAAGTCISSLPRFPNLDDDDDEVAVSQSRLLPSLKLRPRKATRNTKKHITSSFRFATTPSSPVNTTRFVTPISTPIPNTTITTPPITEDRQTTQKELDCDSSSSNHRMVIDDTSRLFVTPISNTTTIGDVRIMREHYTPPPSRLTLKPRFKNNTRKSLPPPTDQEDRCANRELPFLF